MVRYVDTGVEYLGRVPDTWEVVPAKSLFLESKEKRHEDDERLTPSQKFGVVSQVEYMRLVGGNIVLADKGLDDWKHVEPNDYIISLRSFQGGLEMSRITGCVTWHYIVLRPRQEICPGYYKHLFKCDGYIAELNSTCQYLRDGQDLRYSNFVQVPLPIPPMDEQRAIAAYLDKACADIDRAIEAAESSIADYMSYKQSVIYKATVKGLNSDMKQADSGYPWLGSIPCHWAKRRVKDFLRVKSIKGFPDETVLSLYREYGVIPKDSRDDNHNVTSLNTETYKLVEEGDFVVNKMKAWQGSMALSGYRGIISPAYHVFSFHSDDINLEYFHYLLRNRAYASEYARLSTGIRIGQWDLHVEDFLAVPVLLPTEDEQQEIVAYLDEKCAQIDAAIAAKRSIIDELKAYKKSLVYEYVTGKREVPCQ